MVDERYGVGRAATPIELDADERVELERRAGSLTLAYRVVVRAKLVLLAADGATNVQIAGRVDMSPERVRARYTQMLWMGLRAKAAYLPG